MCLKRSIMTNEISKTKSKENELKALIQELKEEVMVSKMEICK